MSLATSRRRLLAVLLVLLAVLVTLWSLQRRLTYFPAGPPPPVQQVLPGASAVTLRTDDGLALDGWWLADGPTAVLVLPGNGGNRAGRAPLARALGDLGLSVLLVDYRGYGGNPGSPSQAGLLSDARAGADWLASRPGVERVVYLGESLGGAVAVGLARDRPPAAVILRSPFASLGDVARAHYGPVPSWFLRDPFPADEWIASLTAPLLVVASEADEVVPYASSRRLARAAGRPEALLSVPDLGHNDRELLDGDVLLRAIERFLGDHGLLPHER